MNKNLLAIKTSSALTVSQRETLGRALETVAETLGVQWVVLENDLDVELHRDNSPLLTQILEEQRKTNQLLKDLVAASSYVA